MTIDHKLVKDARPSSKAQWRYFLDDLKRVRAGGVSKVGMSEAELEEALRTPYASLPDRAEGVKKRKTFLDRINPPKRRSTFVHHILGPIRRGVVDAMDIYAVLVFGLYKAQQDPDVPNWLGEVESDVEAAVAYIREVQEEEAARRAVKPLGPYLVAQ